MKSITFYKCFLILLLTFSQDFLHIQQNANAMSTHYEMEKLLSDRVQKRNNRSSFLTKAEREEIKDFQKTTKEEAKQISYALKFFLEVEIKPFADLSSDDSVEFNTIFKAWGEKEEEKSALKEFGIPIELGVEFAHDAKTKKWSTNPIFPGSEMIMDSLRKTKKDKTDKDLATRQTKWEKIKAVVKDLWAKTAKKEVLVKIFKKVVKTILKAIAKEVLMWILKFVAKSLISIFLPFLVPFIFIYELVKTLKNFAGSSISEANCQKIFLLKYEIATLGDFLALAANVEIDIDFVKYDAMMTKIKTWIKSKLVALGKWFTGKLKKIANFLAFWKKKDTTVETRLEVELADTKAEVDDIDNETKKRMKLAGCKDPLKTYVRQNVMVDDEPEQMEMNDIETAEGNRVEDDTEVAEEGKVNKSK